MTLPPTLASAASIYLVSSCSTCTLLPPVITLFTRSLHLEIRRSFFDIREPSPLQSPIQITRAKICWRAFMYLHLCMIVTSSNVKVVNPWTKINRQWLRIEGMCPCTIACLTVPVHLFKLQAQGFTRGRRSIDGGSELKACVFVL